MESGVCSLDEGEEKFLVKSKNVAEGFLNLYWSDFEKLGVKSPGTQPTAKSESLDLPATTPDPTSLAVARKLRQIGDDIQKKVDAELTAILSKQSVMEMGLEQFTKTCRTVLAKCSGSMSSGWQQVYTVYYSMVRVVQELRQQPNLPEQSLRQRAAHLQQFAGPVMQDLGLDAWLEVNGGLVRMEVML